MYTEVNNKYISQYHKLSAFASKEIFLNKNKNITSIKKVLKHLKIEDPNSNIRLTPKDNKNNLTSNNFTNSINSYIFDEKLNKRKKRKDICMTKIFSDEELSAYKCDSSNKNLQIAYSKRKSNKKFIKKSYEENILKNKPLFKNVNSIKKAKLTKNFSHKKFKKLYIPISYHDSSIYDYYKKMKINNIPKTTRNNNDSSNSSRNKVNNIIYILNKKSFKNSNKSKSNIESNNNKKDNKNKKYHKNSCNYNSIISHPTSNIKTSFSGNFFYIKKNLLFFDKSSKYNLTKSDNYFINNKDELLNDFNTKNASINKHKEEKSNSNNNKKKNINLIKFKKKTKMINFLDLIKNKNLKIKNGNLNDNIFKFKSFDNFKNSFKNNSNFKKPNSVTSKGKKLKKYKTNNNSIENLRKYKIHNIFKSCNVSLLKKKKKINKILPLEITNKDKNFNHKFTKNFINKTSCNKIIPFSKNINKRKKMKKLTDLNLHTFTERDYYDNNILESDNENNKELINEIKINKFDINKPSEQNMKYTNVKEYIEEEKEESHLSKIIIGEIDGYNDIIEKDRINNLLNKNQKSPCINNDKVNNKIKKENQNIINNSIESEKLIINMINLEDDIDYISTDDFKNNNVKTAGKSKRYNIKNIAFYVNDLNQNKNFENKKLRNNLLKNRINIGNNFNKLITKKPVKINNLKSREEIKNKINNKVNDKKNTLNKLNIKKDNIINNININNNNKKMKINKNLKIKSGIDITINRKNFTKNSFSKNKNDLISSFIKQKNENEENCIIF